ncbi:MAG: sigma-70 family RNA polymerase sigma factor [Gemmatimonadetes bacterium]|nr:sigma-70 family RNA polymerase sigma factor [Gemmatimonadota bacterium]
MVEPPGLGSQESLPPEMADLLSARDEAAATLAWDRFLDSYSRLLLHTARATIKNRDAAMDAYAYILGKLREDDFGRLRMYSAGGRARFSTWLVIVSRRLVLDHRRSRYGRDRGTESQASQERLEARRRLADLISDVPDIDLVPSVESADHGRTIRLAELRKALEEVLMGLEPRDRLLLSLRFVDGLPGREIADLMGLPTPFHVYRRLNAVLAQLRGELETRGIDEAEP